MAPTTLYASLITVRSFWNIIDRLRKELATLRAAESVQGASIRFRLPKSRLQGWDCHDLVTNEEHIFKKELPRTFKHMTWWDLVDSKRFNVIFGENFDQLIRPVFPSSVTLESSRKNTAPFLLRGLFRPTAAKVYLLKQEYLLLM